MNIEYDQRRRGEPLHTVKNLNPGQAFRVEGGQAIYLRLHGQVIGEKPIWDDGHSLVHSGDHYKKGRTPQIFVPAGHLPVISLETGRLYTFPEGREILPVYADIVIKD